MDHLFTPSRRLQTCLDYIHIDSIFDEPHGYTEVQLAVSIEAFLKHSWDWSDLQAFFIGDESEMVKILWITEDMFIWVEEDNNKEEFEELGDYVIERATFTATSGETHDLVLAKVGSSVSLSAGVSSVFWHAVTTSKCVKLKLESMRKTDGVVQLCSGPALLHFLETSLSLKLLEFKDFSFEEADCRALASLKRTSLEITFEQCTFDAEGAEDTFIEWLRHSQVVTKLDSCEMGNNTLFFTLNGNGSVKTLSMDATHGDFLMCCLSRGTYPYT
jgi:hypothetical protein